MSISKGEGTRTAVEFGGHVKPFRRIVSRRQRHDNRKAAVVDAVRVLIRSECPSAKAKAQELPWSLEGMLNHSVGLFPGGSGMTTAKPPSSMPSGFSSDLNVHQQRRRHKNCRGVWRAC